MRDIYAEADNVRVWLGEENEMDKNAFEVIERMSQYVGTFLRAGPSSNAIALAKGLPLLTTAWYAS